MRVTTKTNLAIRVLTYCAVQADGLARSADIAKACNASLNHVSRVIFELQRLGYVTTIRGRNGGLRLAQPMEQIKIGEVFRNFEAAIPLAECFDPATNTCPLIDSCRLKAVLGKALDAFYAELDSINLGDLVKDNNDLAFLVAQPPAGHFACQPA